MISLDVLICCKRPVRAILTWMACLSRYQKFPRPPRSAVADQLLAEVEQALAGERSVLVQHDIHNYDRTIGASLAGEIARRYGNKGLPGVSITCTFQGSAGQSFGAFSVPG